MNNQNDRINQAIRITWIGFSVNVALTLFKLSAGIFGRSGAMVADAIHSLSDFITDIVVVMGFKVVKKPIDENHDYGHGKFETMSATITGIILLFAGAGILWSGSVNIYMGLQGAIIQQPELFAFIAAIISIIVKEFLYHSTIRIGNRINSQAVIANAWHHRTDAFSSFGTLIGIGGAIFLAEKWRILDPIAAVVVSFFIIKLALSIIYKSIQELMECSLSEEIENTILILIDSTDGVKDPHNLRTRRIGNSIAIDIHIRVDSNLTIVQSHDIATIVEKKLRDNYGLGTFVSIHMEPDLNK